MELTNRDPAEPRPAATVLILRDAPAGVEVVLTRRSDHLRFMGGAVVFPGGAVSGADHDERWMRAATGDPRGPDGSVDVGTLPWAVCALRESFEETGFLLGNDAARSLARADARDPGRFLERCLALAAVLDTAALVPVGRWTTPEGATARFDTRFFCARAPGGWEPDPDPREVSSCWWSSADRALAEVGAGRVVMAPPTVQMLQDLASFARVDDALEGMGRAGAARTGILQVRLAPGVHVVLAPNPGPMTGPGTNTYVVGTGPTVVIDPASDDAAYLDAVAEVAGGFDAILVTHRHPDHTGGVAPLLRRHAAEVRAFGTDPVASHDVRPLTDGDRIEAGDATLVALHTPGHAPDHLCFHLPEQAALFAGDNILGEGTTVVAPPEGDMRRYLESLRRMRALRLDRIYPGHWRPVARPGEVIDSYLAHRREREEQILGALAAGAGTVADIVARVYDDVPGHLHPVAALQVQAHLTMLVEDGRVHEAGQRWKLLEPET